MSGQRLVVGLKCKDNPTCRYEGEDLFFMIEISHSGREPIEFPLELIKRTGPSIRLIGEQTGTETWLPTLLPRAGLADLLVPIGPGQSVSMNWVLKPGDFEQLGTADLSVRVEAVVDVRIKRNGAQVAARGIGSLRVRRGAEHLTGPIRVSLELASKRVPRGNALELRAVINNPSARPLRLNTTLLSYPSLALRVRDADRRPVPLGPPPTPRADDGLADREDIPAGGSLTRTYRAIFGVDPPPGRYAVAFQTTSNGGPKGADWVGVLESDWIEFEIR